MGKFPPSCRPFRLLMNSWQLMLFPMFCGRGDKDSWHSPASHSGTHPAFPPSHLSVQVSVQEHDGASQGVDRVCPEWRESCCNQTLRFLCPHWVGDPQMLGFLQSPKQTTAPRDPALLPTEEKSLGLQWWKRLENWYRTRSRSWVSPLSTRAWRKPLHRGQSQAPVGCYPSHPQPTPERTECYRRAWPKPTAHSLEAGA